MFFQLYRHTDDGVFDEFPKISIHFPIFFQDFLKLLRRPHGHSRTFSENFLRLLKTIEEDPKMFLSYDNDFKDNLRDKLDISETIDIFTSEDIENTAFDSRM